MTNNNLRFIYLEIEKLIYKFFASNFIVKFPTRNTPARIARINGLNILTLETTLLGLKMMVKSGRFF